MARRNYRGNNTYLIEGNTGDNPKLMGQSLSDGRDSLYLEFYLGYEIAESKYGTTYKKIRRSTERLGLYIWQAPRNPQERQQNKEILTIAKRIRFERGQELLESAEGYRLRKDRNANLLDWMREYYRKYSKADKRLIKSAFNSFVDFLENPEDVCDKRSAPTPASMLRHSTQVLKPRQLTKQLVLEYKEYLLRRFTGEGPHTHYARFKKMIRAAVDAELLLRNPCDGITIKVDNGSLKKDVLSIDEVKKLVVTHYHGENPDIRRAFIFCLYSGMRWCDVVDLTYANIDYSSRRLQFEQNKTKGRSSASGVVIPLNEGMLALIGTGDKKDLIFPLPSHTMCLKALRTWVKHAGIDKHITWHCARHSFAVNILSNGANIKTVASLLGHSGLGETEKYTRAVDSLKEAAINSLPELSL